MNKVVFCGLLAVFLLCPAAAAATEKIIPTGYISLCKERPPFCVRDRAQVSHTLPYATNPMTLQILQRVNTKWNARIKAVVDNGEHWTGSTLQGDCEEFAIAKRNDLLSRNFLPSQVLLVRVLDKEGAGHLITAVRTDVGIYILDNLYANILTFEESGYVLTSRQREDNPHEWTNDTFS